MKSIAQKLMAVLSAVVLMTTLLIPAFQASAASVKLNRTKIVLAVGQTYALKLRGTNRTVKWSTSNKKVATVTKKGVVKGVKKGNAVITAKVGKKTYKCKVSVEAPKLSAAKKTVTAGTRFTLKLNGTKRTVKWYTSNKKVATVTQKGVVKTLKAGTVRITAKVGGKAYVCKVTVKAAVSPEKVKAAATYNSLVNALKNEKNVTIQRVAAVNMKLSNLPELVQIMLGDSLKDLTDDLNQTEKETRSFINGKSPVGNGTDITLNEYLPPEGKKASLKDSYIKSTNTVKTADGGYKLTIVLKSETSKFDGNKFSATPANASVSTAFSSFDFGDGSDSIPFDMSLQFSGTKLEATANAAGKLVGLKIYSPMKMVMPLDITMGGYSSQTYTVTYR